MRASLKMVIYPSVWYNIQFIDILNKMSTYMAVDNLENNILKKEKLNIVILSLNQF